MTAEQRYNILAGKVKLMLDTQADYFKTRDHNILKKAKALEKDVRQLIDPKPLPLYQQALSPEFLAL